jgi:hypothetical protein
VSLFAGAAHRPKTLFLVNCKPALDAVHHPAVVLDVAAGSAA